MFSAPTLGHYYTQLNSNTRVILKAKLADNIDLTADDDSTFDKQDILLIGQCNNLYVNVHNTNKMGDGFISGCQCTGIFW